MAQASQAQIYQLAQAGIATHVIPDQAGVDPVFAMARARDMPDVHFAALFEKETLVLGCPNGLPDDLAPLASPIDLSAFEVAVAQTSTTAGDEADHSDTTQKKIALLADRIASLMPAPDGGAPNAASLAQLEERLIASVDARLTQMDPTAGLTQVLEAQIALQNALDQPAPPGRTDDGLRKTITQLLDDSQARHDALMTHLTNLQDAMQQPLSDADAAPDLTSALSEIQHALVAQSEAQHATMVQLVTEGLAALQTAHAAAEPPDMSAIQSTLSAIEGHLAELTSRPAPMLDLTAQRKSFASFGTALAGTLLRFEALAERIEKGSVSDAASNTTVSEKAPTSDDMPAEEEQPAQEDGIAAAPTDLEDDVATEVEETASDLGPPDLTGADQVPEGPEIEVVLAEAPDDHRPTTNLIDAEEPPTEDPQTSVKPPEETEVEIPPETALQPVADPSPDDAQDIIIDQDAGQHDTPAERPAVNANDVSGDDTAVTTDDDGLVEHPGDVASEGSPDPDMAASQNTTVQGLSPDDRLIGASPPSDRADEMAPTVPGQPQITLDDLRSLFAELIATQMRDGGMPPPPGPQAQTTHAEA